MPELPEVENFRKLLLPLVSKSVLSIEAPSESPPKSFLSPEDIKALHKNCHVSDVLRKGKLICLVLECQKKVHSQKRLYLFLHMGMTGRISTPDHVPGLESLSKKKKAAYPPPHTHLTLKTDSAEASFSDPRKFGSVSLSTSLDQFDELAPDALTIEGRKLKDGLVDQSTIIKSILLDQKRVLSGVGNWVADEVLYQSQMHPEQTYLTEQQVETLGAKLHDILTTAIDCLESGSDFPKQWIFHLRWKKRAASQGNAVRDYKGRSVTFLPSAGRTSAIVPKIQTKRSQKKQRSEGEDERKAKEKAGGKKEKSKRESSPKTNRKRKSSSSSGVKSKTTSTGVSEQPSTKRRSSPRLTTSTDGHARGRG